MSHSGQSDLKAQVSSGVFWSGGSRVAQQGIQFGLSVVLARLLSPGDYGLMAMAMVFTGFAGMLADAGFNSAIIQRKDLRDEHIYTVFWITVGSGVLLAGLTFVLAPWLAVFFKTPALKRIARVIAINFILGGIGNVPSALLQRRMQFRTIAKIEITALVLSGAVGVAMAALGAGVWTLVAQSLSASLLTSALRWRACRWVPAPIFCRSAFKDIWAFSSYLYAFNFINYWSRNADNLVVGKFFGAPALGAYNRAYALMLLPINQVNGVITQVLFPAFSTIQDDKERIKRIYLRAIGIVALLAFPIMMGLSVVVEPFILTVYGPKWIEVAGILQILTLVGLLQVLGNSTGWLFLSQGRTDMMLLWGTICSIASIASFAVGVLIGSVRAVAICYAVVNVLYFYPELTAAGKVANMKGSEILRAVAGPFLSSLLMAAVVAAIGYMVPAGWRPWQILAVLVFTGVVSYSAIVVITRLQAAQDLEQIIQEKRRGRREHSPLIGMVDV